MDVNDFRAIDMTYTRSVRGTDRTLMLARGCRSIGRLRRYCVRERPNETVRSGDGPYN